MLGSRKNLRRRSRIYAVIGIYMYDGTVFDKVRELVPSGRGELEITDVNNAYIREGTMTYAHLDGWWTDAGTFDSLLRAANLVATSKPPGAAEAKGRFRVNPHIKSRYALICQFVSDISDGPENTGRVGASASGLGYHKCIWGGRNDRGGNERNNEHAGSGPGLTGAGNAGLREGIGKVIVAPTRKIDFRCSCRSYPVWPDDRGYFLEVARMGRGLRRKHFRRTPRSAPPR